MPNVNIIGSPPKVAIDSDNNVLVGDTCCCIPTLFCDSISASKTKCGNAGFIDPTTFFLVSTQQVILTSGEGVAPCSTGGPHYCTEDRDTTTIVTFDPTDCSSVATCSGSSHYLDTDGNDATFSWIPGMGGCVFDPLKDFNCCDCPLPGDSISSNTVAQSTCSEDEASASRTTTLYDEYTTDLLKSITVDALPDYSGFFHCADDDCPSCEDSFDTGQGCLCSAIRELSEDETSYSIQRFKYLFVLDDPPAAGAILYWDEEFTPDDMTGPVDTAKTFTWDGVVTQSDIFEIDEPTANGYTFVTNVRWTP